MFLVHQLEIDVMLLTTLLEGRAINYFMSALQIMMKLLLAPFKGHLHHRYNNLKYVPHLLTDCLPTFNNQPEPGQKGEENIESNSILWIICMVKLYILALFLLNSRRHLVDTCFSARSISTPWAQGTAGLARQSPLFALLVKSMRCLCK